MDEQLRREAIRQLTASGYQIQTLYRSPAEREADQREYLRSLHIKNETTPR